MEQEIRYTHVVNALHKRFDGDVRFIAGNEYDNYDYLIEYNISTITTEDIDEAKGIIARHFNINWDDINSWVNGV